MRFCMRVHIGQGHVKVKEEKQMELSFCIVVTGFRNTTTHESKTLKKTIQTENMIQTDNPRKKGRAQETDGGLDD